MKSLKKIALILCLGTAFAGFVACGAPSEIFSSKNSSTSQASSNVESTSTSISALDNESSSAFESSFTASSSFENSSSEENSGEENSSELNSSDEDSSSEENNSSKPEDSSSSDIPSYDLDGVISYLETKYADFYQNARSDYYLVNNVVYLDNKYTVTWSVDVDCITVKEQEMNYWIDVDEATLEDVPYVLTATVIAPDNSSKEISFNRVLIGIRAESSAVELDLKELRTNIDDYVGRRVAFECTVTTYANWTIYVEDYDEETQMYYGMTVFYGYNFSFHPILAPGNRVRIVGNLTKSETYGYQISNLKYDAFDPYNPDNIIKLGEGYEGAYREVSEEEFFSQIEIDGETFDFPELAFNTTISINNLKVVDAYTTNNGGDASGAITLTCQWGEKSIHIRISAIKNADDELVFTEDMLLNKTIDVRGVIEQFNDQYQIKIHLSDQVIIH